MPGQGPSRVSTRLAALRRSPDAAYLVLLATVFAASRVAAYAAGVRYASGELAIAIQNLAGCTSHEAG